MLTPVEQQLLVEWNDTQTIDRSMRSSTEAQVERTPDAIVVFENQQLTYRS